MSQLATVVDHDLTDGPRILSFLELAPQHQKCSAGADERARLEFHNRCCPLCNRVTVEPVELRNGRIGRNGAVIRGTGTLVGFSCNACGHEWPAHAVAANRLRLYGS